jgi:hypothetical protein
LEPPHDFSDRFAFDVPALAHEAQAVNEVKRDKRFTVIVGNPPYSNFSANLAINARNLVTKYKFMGQVKVMERNALQLERNLNDDYVKFIAWSEDRLKSASIWVRNVCDRHVYDPNEDLEERIFWRKWQAPLFLIMKPSLSQPFDPATVWDREDAESSLQLLEHFAEHYVLHLEIKLRRAAGDATLALAKQPQPRPVETSTSGNSSREVRPATTTGNGYTPNNARREARKLDTEAKYASWQKAYRRLLKNRPNMSDVWYSQQIAKMDIAKGSSPETIRKNMKK